MAKAKTPRAPWERARTAPAGSRPEAARPTGANAGGRSSGPRPPVAASRQSLPPELCVIGRHAVKASLTHHTARCLELFHTDSPDLGELILEAKARRIPTRQVDVDVIDALAGGRDQGSAQGVVLSCAPFPYITVDEVDALPMVTLALDGVEDPRNFGAAARAAYALGAGLVVVPADRAAQATAAAIKASAGALCRIPVAREVNFKRALTRLKDKGAWIVGAEADGDRAPWDVDATGHLVIVIGGEDRGLRRLTREACDFVTAIPMTADDMSLNAADAATLLLYEALRQRTVATKATRPLPPRGP
jgi:23S rRNA (guanosine2251-2'-O)-methyltransferase